MCDRGTFSTSDIRKYNSGRARADMPDIQMINVVDGGGRLARKNDLKVMHQHCDYALATRQLDMLIPILNHHMSMS